MNQEPNDQEREFQVIEEYANAIGMLTIYWAALENALTVAIEYLLHTDEVTAQCIATSLDKASGRATLIQRLVYRPNEAPSEEWRDCMAGLCNQICNIMGPKRNRLIHDQWNSRADGMLRHNPALKVGKQQSRAAKTLLSEPPSPSHVPEIEALTTTVVDAMVYVTGVAHQYQIWKRTGRILKVPEQAIRASKGLPRAHPPREA
jgi:hypothetical protein